MDSDNLVNYVLRGTECLFSIIAFSVLFVYAGDSSKIDYLLFTGISSMVITVAFILVYLLDWEDSQLMRAIELYTNLIWWVFWFTAAIITSTNLFSSRMEASCAFSWMTWVLWNVSCLKSFAAYRNSRSG